MPSETSLTSTPDFSQRFAISFIKEIFVAKKEFEAYLINSAPLLDVKNNLAELSIDIAERIIKKDLSSESSQKKYVEDLIKEINKTK